MGNVDVSCIHSPCLIVSLIGHSVKVSPFLTLFQLLQSYHLFIGYCVCLFVCLTKAALFFAWGQFEGLSVLNNPRPGWSVSVRTRIHCRQASRVLHCPAVALQLQWHCWTHYLQFTYIVQQMPTKLYATLASHYHFVPLFDIILLCSIIVVTLAHTEH